MQTLHREFTQNKQSNNHKSEFEDEKDNSIQDGFGSPETVEMISTGRGDPIVCRLEPFNLCYRFDESGTMHPIGDRRPVRLIRVYK